MAEHDELVSEMAILETMGTQERQKLAKKRRIQQLKRWTQREKEWIAKEKQLNKRLANIMIEENNGLNLKQYTTYNSNQRAKNRLVTSNDDNNANGKTASVNNVPTKEYNNNGTIYGPYSNTLQPNNRIHFNPGVMLLEAAARNDYEEAKRLLSLGVSPDSVNHDGLTALHQCCIDASEPMMQLLLDYGANVDARDTEQWTPLHAACTCGHLKLVKKLVEHNADLLAVNGDGNMPFDICEDEATLDYIESQMVEQGITQEMIDLTRASNEMHMLNELEEMVSNQADLNQADENGATRLHIAATNNYLSAVKFMLNHGVDVNVCDNDHWRPLHGVACWGNEQHMKIVELLVEAGANLDAKTLNDETVFDLCDNGELLERMNQLKDELESKQAKGTDRLKRTQSRTNSRVHSVRRTSVRDKNQISRREAREEALLRVDSNSEVPQPPPVDASDNHQRMQITAEPKTIDDGLHPTEGDVNDESEQEVRKSETLTTKLKVTNLDGEPEGSMNNPSEVEPMDNQCSVNDHQRSNDDMQSTRSQHTTQSIDIHRDGNLFDDLADDEFVSKPRVTGTRLVEGDPSSQPQNSQQTISKSSNSMAINPTTTVKVSVTHTIQPGIPSNQAQQASEPGSVNMVHQQQASTTTVQVQFAPTNYTLSNLKKHRSDLRMRSCSIGGGVSTTRLNNVDSGKTHNSLIYSTNPTANGAKALVPVMAAKEAVLYDPEISNDEDLMLRSNGSTSIDLFRSESPSSTFKKFRGEPSQAFEGDSCRRTRRKCCMII